MSAGSGVVIDSRGYILTNNHVVEDARHLFIVTRAPETASVINAFLEGADAKASKAA